MPELAADLVRRRVNVIVTTSTGVARGQGGDHGTPARLSVSETILSSWVWSPVSAGRVATQPDQFFRRRVGGKAAGAAARAVPCGRSYRGAGQSDRCCAHRIQLEDVDAAARAIRLQIHIVNASTIAEIDAAFASLARERVDAMFVVPNSFFNSRRVQLANLAARFAISSAFGQREYCEVGGLMSYGTNLADARRQIGSYAGRILKGVRAADLPVVQATTFELVINLTTARTLGLTAPPSVLATADEVIE